MEKKLRKQQNLLVDAGMGVILFGIWGVAKINMYMAMSSEFAEAWQSAIQISGVDGELFTRGLWIFISVILVIDLLSRLYIGFSAVADGKGKKKGYGYIVLSALVLVSNLHSSWLTYSSGFQQINVNTVMGLLMEVASLYVMVEVTITAIRVRRLRKTMKR